MTSNTPGPALPPLPKPIGLGLQRYEYQEEDMRAYALKAIEAYKDDAARLDWLESINKPFQMEWHILQSPAGNIGIRSVINLSGVPQESFREAIDKARAAIAAAGRKP